MTRRISAILCVLTLLLSACSKPGTINDSADKSDVSAQTQSVSQTEEQPFSSEPVDSELPTEEEPTVYVPTESEAQSVTAGGYKVRIDTSHYTPYQPPESKFVRPEGVDLSEFHPENANGPVYPYASDVLYSSYEGGYSGTAGYHYGFFDSTGILVTDGIYTGCEPAVAWDNITNSEIYYPFWSVSRMGEVELIHYEDEGYSYVYPEGYTLYGIVAMDGSFSIPCEYRGLSVRDDRIICTRDYQTGDYVVYDLNGNLIMTTSRLFDQSCDWRSLNYGEGLYLVLNHYNNKKSECYYCRESGERVLGPYVSAEPFHDGLACVSADGTHYGMIDKTGSWVIPPRYTSVGSFIDGKAIVSDEKNYYLIDQTGNVILQKDADSYNSSFNRVSCGFQYTPNYENSYREFFDPDGNLLMASYGNWACLNETVFYKAQGNGVTLHSLDDSIQDLTVPDVSYLSLGFAYVDGKLQQGFVYDNYEDRTLTFVPLDLSTWRIIDRSDNDYNLGYFGSANLTDNVTGETYYCIYSNGKRLIFDTNLEQVGTCDSNYPRMINGMVMDLQGLCCTYHTLDGKLVFCYPYQGDGD